MRVLPVERTLQVKSSILNNCGKSLAQSCASSFISMSTTSVMVDEIARKILATTRRPDTTLLGIAIWTLNLRAKINNFNAVRRNEPV